MRTSEEDILLAQSLVNRTGGLGPGGRADTGGVPKHGVNVLAPVGGNGAHNDTQHVNEAQDHLLVQRRVRADRPISAEGMKKEKKLDGKKQRDKRERSTRGAMDRNGCKNRKSNNKKKRKKETQSSCCISHL